MNSLPDPKYFEYFSRLFHSNQLTPWFEFKFTEGGFKYPEVELERFSYLFLTDPTYIENQKILDLGCHVGYMSFICNQMNAKSVHGVNIRQYPIEIANYCFEQLQLKNYQFSVGDLENFDYLKTICSDVDTVILSEVLEHCRNPLTIVNIISNSNIKNLILASSFISDTGPPILEYRLEKTNTNYTSAVESNKEVTLACAPNLSWLTTVLYHYNWKIEHLKTLTVFNKNAFSVPNQQIMPKIFKKVFILAKKFESSLPLQFDGWRL